MFIRKYILSVIIASAGFIIALILMELYFEFAEIVSPSVVDVDAHIGPVFRPGKNLVLFKEGFYVGGTNKYGYLGPAYPPSKNENTFRIALIGDSYVEGFQLFDRHHFRNIMEKELKKDLQKDVEVLNFGRSGFSFPDMYCYFKNFVMTFSPDIVIFFVHQTDLDTHEQMFGPRCYINNGKLDISYAFNQTDAFKSRGKTDFLRGKLSLLSLVSNCGKLYSEGLTWEILLDKFYVNYLKKGENGESRGNNPAMSRIDSAIVRELNKINHASSQTYIMVVDMGMNNDAINIFTNLGLVVIKPSPALEKIKNEGIDPHVWKAARTTGHWNHEANKAVGVFLAGEIKKIFK